MEMYLSYQQYKIRKKYIYNDTEEQKVANSHILEAAIYKNFLGIFAVTMTEVIYQNSNSLISSSF